MATLSERYVAAVSRRVPENQRTDVELEVKAAIGDLVDARLAAGETPAGAEREALAELGDPVRLAADYAGRPLHLIGPALYPDYIRLLTVLLAVVVPIAGAGVLLGTLLASGNPGETAANTVLTVMSVILHIFFWVTLIFALIERGGTKKPLTRWDPEQLPDVPQAGQPRLGDTIVSIVLLLFAAGYILWQQFRSPFTDTAGAPVPLFDPALWSFWLPYFIAVLASGIVLEVVRYHLGGWNLPLFTINLVLNLAVAVPAVWLLLAGQLLHDEFLDRLTWWPSAQTDATAAGVVVIIGITVWDIIDTAVKTRRDRHLAARHTESARQSQRVS